MSSKNTWLWVALAAFLFAFIFVYEHYFRSPESGPPYLLPGLDTRTVKSFQIRAANQLNISLQRTNAGWQLTEPIVYPARTATAQNLLDALQRLTVSHRISEQELRKDPDADENYGIEPPQLSLVLRQIDSTNRIYFGRRTAPGDEVFVRIIGISGVSVVDAGVLNLFPPSADAWRETALVDFAQMKFDSVTVTNAARSFFQFQRNPSNHLWGMTLPMTARADNKMVEDALQSMDKLGVRRFVSDDPKAELDTFGFQPPALTIAFGEGTNALLTLDFGKELTNSPGLVYARRRDGNAVVAVSTNALTLWQAAYESFRDRHLVTLTAPLDKITVHARDDFSLQWLTNNSWRVEPQGFPAETAVAAGLAQTLSELQVADFEKDSVTEPDLPHYGLAPPSRKYILAWADALASTNPPAELDFGTNSAGKIFARRVGEDAVYGIAPEDFAKLPDASWETRERQIWNFNVADISRIIIQQNGRTREIVHRGTNGWSLAPGTQGIINDSAVENTVGELVHLQAYSWTGRGSQNLAGFGFTPQSWQITIDLKNGQQRTVQFGGPTDLGSPYALVQLNGEPWIFEFPPDLFPSVQYCLTIPTAP